jgi:hypothetical protein
MGIVGILPAVFVRAANTGLTGYGTWKSVQRIENKGFASVLFARKCLMGSETCGEGGRRWRRDKAGERQEEAREESFDSSADGGLRMRILVGCARRGPTPLLFVSVAAKGFSSGASLLFTTLAERSIGVAAKGLTEADCWREGN